MKPDYRSLLIILFLGTGGLMAQNLYELPKEKAHTRWISFENISGQKGAGGKENQGAKGRAFERLDAGESVELVNFDGSGLITRIWLTINDRSPEMLRALKIEMFWDGEDKPAVSVPLGDFFGIGLGRKAAFESVFFSDPEGRSFNCFIPMPFRKKAVIKVTNESKKKLDQIFFEVNLLEMDHPEEELLYFHAFWEGIGKPFRVKTLKYFRR